MFLSTSFVLAALLSLGEQLPVAVKPAAKERFLLKCRISTPNQRDFVRDQVEHHGLDVWHESTPKEPSDMTILATVEQIIVLRSRLNCTTPTNVEFIEKLVNPPGNQR